MGNGMIHCLDRSRCSWLERDGNEQLLAEPGSRCSKARYASKGSSAWFKGRSGEWSCSAYMSYEGMAREAVDRIRKVVNLADPVK